MELLANDHSRYSMVNIAKREMNKMKRLFAAATVTVLVACGGGGGGDIVSPGPIQVRRVSWRDHGSADGTGGFQSLWL
jgi:hypothetical protein